MIQFSEATRVQMPAMVHLTRIGYTYFGKLSEDGVSPRLMMSQFSSTCLVRNRWPTIETQMRYKNELKKCYQRSLSLICKKKGAHNERLNNQL